MEIRNINNIMGIEQSHSNKISKLKTNRSLGNDDVQISEEARKLAEEQKIQDTIERAPDVREDKIAEIKAKMQSGAYNDPKIMEDVAEKLMKVLGF